MGISLDLFPFAKGYCPPALMRGKHNFDES
jgi:hypothetical protein